ncbi:hypothetical protein [Streptomyces minutiscleroticus]|uniref:hypothetical protein n=1 Tax=Streptomyces minutiscleroticus TaxID=68238 RepID=UPI00167D6E1A|nr:hypothetical protein [Streptomyces minutiscleroticus]
MVRRPVAWAAAIVLLLEGVGVALLNWLLGVVVDRQDMSLAGLDPHAMSVSSKAAGIVFGLYFAFCAVVALRVAQRDRPPAGVGRILLISAAVVHALLGAFCVGLVGWGAFAFMMVVLGMLLLLLLGYDRREGAGAATGPGGAEPGPGGTEAGSGGKEGGSGGPARPPAPAAP